MPRETQTAFLDSLTVWQDANPVRPGALNMAIDELLLETVETPWLRWYGWDRPTVSIGYFEPEPEAGVPVVRRRTGGGRVEHGGDRDYTYAIGVPRCCGEPLRRPRDSYALIHAALAAAMAQVGIVATLAAETAGAAAGGACFSNPVEADVLLRDGAKIAGGGQRRSKAGMLHQGSIQGVSLPPGFPNRFAAALGRRWSERPLPDRVPERAEEIAARRYPPPAAP